MHESCDIVDINPPEWPTHMLNNQHNDTPPEQIKQLLPYSTTKNLTNNPREIFLNQPDGLFRMLTYVVIIHIGVGSNVVCSTIPGNAKSSVRGTDNKEIPTFEPKNPSLNHLYISFVYN